MCCLTCKVFCCIWNSFWLWGARQSTKRHSGDDGNKVLGHSHLLVWSRLQPHRGFIENLPGHRAVVRIGPVLCWYVEEKGQRAHKSFVLWNRILHSVWSYFVQLLIVGPWMHPKMAVLVCPAPFSIPGRGTAVSLATLWKELTQESVNRMASGEVCLRSALVGPAWPLSYVAVANLHDDFLLPLWSLQLLIVGHSLHPRMAK